LEKEVRQRKASLPGAKSWLSAFPEFNPLLGNSVSAAIRRAYLSVFANSSFLLNAILMM
jgi:hypothetical protein